GRLPRRGLPRHGPRHGRAPSHGSVPHGCRRPAPVHSGRLRPGLRALVRLSHTDVLLVVVTLWGL
ncbi:hypothetical protein, partial [Streptomyces sp. NPDC006875]|uniref:hypothetical protein n=1 Tax=Streptomyces sp. NPDC006875 TaxID=3154781 RepID=UPI0034017FA5